MTEPKAPRFDSVDAYLTTLTPTKATTLASIIELILKEFPELEAKISWNVPQIHRDGEYVFGASSAKHHLSLAPWSSQVLEANRDRLESQGYVVKKNLFQVSDDWEIDSELIKDVVTARLAELQQKERHHDV